MSGEPGAADQKATEPRGHCPSATSSCAWGQMPLQGAGPAPLALGKATALPVCEVPTEPEPEGLQDNQADPLVLAFWPQLCRWLVQRQFGRVLDLLLPVWRDPVRDPGDSPSPSVGGAARNRGAASSRGKVLHFVVTDHRLLAGTVLCAGDTRRHSPALQELTMQ